ncbi:MAG: PqqD family peptide modification chaperone [Candidatus Aenigmarchaeota archaeon]|nr:PqqD family peptide modification chaperone [Candidatus Aenigmarchaeota archaeon]
MKIPIKNSKAKIIEFKGSLYASLGDQLFEIDRAAFNVLKLCDGKNNVDDIIDKIAEKIKFPREEVANVVKSIIKELEEKNLIVWKEV